MLLTRGCFLPLDHKYSAAALTYEEKHAKENWGSSCACGLTTVKTYRQRWCYIILKRLVVEESIVL